MTRVIGIDPGHTGALALLVDGHLDIVDMPTRMVGKSKRVDGRRLRDVIVEFGAVDRVIVEFVNARLSGSSSGSFTFGHGAGMIEQALIDLERSHEFANPRSWQGALGILKLDKDAHRGVAAAMFPAHADLFARKKDDGRADAALIAEYGRRIVSGGAAA